MSYRNPGSINSMEQDIMLRAQKRGMHLAALVREFSIGQEIGRQFVKAGWL